MPPGSFVIRPSLEYQIFTFDLERVSLFISLIVSKKSLGTHVHHDLIGPK